MNEEWQNLGNNIKDMVQDAVNCGDFQKLNQNIRSTIDQAMAAVSGNKENSADKTSGSETKSWRARTVRTEYSDSQGRARKSDESVYGRAVKTDGTMRGGNWQSSRTSTRSWSSSSQNVGNAAGVQSQRSESPSGGTENIVSCADQSYHGGRNCPVHLRRCTCGRDGHGSCGTSGSTGRLGTQ
ncbi:MAG: hypothetical protein V8S96_08980 [Lachnospiraceae bacterium]